MHPSESSDFLLTRVIAYALNLEPGLEFTPGGLSDSDEPCLKKVDPRGGLDLCIEIGSPSARRLHKAMKSSGRVKVYTYKDPVHLVREIVAGQVYEAERLEVYSLSPRFLEKVAQRLERDNRWSLMHSDGTVTIVIGDHSESGEVSRHQVSPG